MKIWLAKVSRGEKVGFMPTDEDGERVIRRMGDGELVECDVKRIRSVPWHRMYFGICRDIGQNQDPVRTEGSIDYELRILAGHFETMWVDGHECRFPKRIAFAELTADEWAELWPSLELAIREHFGDEYIQERAA